MIRLSMVFAERIRFIVDEKLAVRRLRFLELIQDEANDVEAESPAARMDADFAVMSLELRGFVRQLLEAFGGEDKAAMGVLSG